MNNKKLSVYYITKSKNSKKKWDIMEKGNGKVISFGGKGYSDYTIHKDKDRKKAYIARHKPRENWGKSGIGTAGFWSRWILWNQSTLTKSIRDTEKRFNINIIKKEKLPKKIPSKYLPGSLSENDRNKQEASIRKSRKDYKHKIYKKRPRVNYKSKKSSYIKKFEAKYNKKITDKNYIAKNIISLTGQNKILKKGRGAFYSSGSRPNQTPSSWAYARLASVIVNGPARKYDMKIWNKYKK